MSTGITPEQPTFEAGQFIDPSPYLNALNEVCGINIPKIPHVFVGEKVEDFKPLIKKLGVLLTPNKVTQLMVDGVRNKSAFYAEDYNACVISPNLLTPNLLIVHELTEAYLHQIKFSTLFDEIHPHATMDIFSIFQSIEGRQKGVEAALIKDTIREGIATWVGINTLRLKPDIGKPYESINATRAIFTAFIETNSLVEHKENYRTRIQEVFQNALNQKIRIPSKYHYYKYPLGYMYLDNYMSERTTAGVTISEALQALIQSPPTTWEELNYMVGDNYPKSFDRSLYTRKD